MNQIDRSIIWLERKLIELQAERWEIEQCIESLRSRRAHENADIPISQEVDQQIEKIIERPSSTESGRDKLRAERPKRDTRRISKYKGVTPGRGRADGTKLWRAYVWRHGGVKFIGNAYESEEAAAAAAAEARGDHAEARTLAAMAEQVENNPDRPTTGHWECNRCGAKKYVKNRPAKCDACGRRSFARITAEGKG